MPRRSTIGTQPGSEKGLAKRVQFVKGAMAALDHHWNRWAGAEVVTTTRPTLTCTADMVITRPATELVDGCSGLAQLRRRRLSVLETFPRLSRFVDRVGGRFLSGSHHGVGLLEGEGRHGKLARVVGGARTPSRITWR